MQFILQLALIQWSFLGAIAYFYHWVNAESLHWRSALAYGPLIWPLAAIEALWRHHRLHHAH